MNEDEKGMKTVAIIAFSILAWKILAYEATHRKKKKKSSSNE